MTMFDVKNILLSIVVLANFLLSLFTYLKNTKSTINKVWGIVSFTVFSWTLSMFLYRISDISDGVFWCKVLYITASLIPSSFVFFAYLFPFEKISLSKTKRFLIFFPNALAIFLILWGDLVIKNVALYSGLEKETSFGPFYPIYFLYIAGSFTWAFLIFLKKYLKADGTLKAQLKYILIGVFSSVIFGTTCNLLFPAIGIFRFEWFGPTATIIFVSFITMAILKYHLFDVKAILTECLVAVMGIILFIMPLVIETVAMMKFLMFAVFLVYCFIGYLLIKLTNREVKAKETLEQKVQERTKDLQSSNEALEQSKKIAEERAKELEKWYSLTIGRELKMAELKEKIKEMEDKK